MHGPVHQQLAAEKITPGARRTAHRALRRSARYHRDKNGNPTLADRVGEVNQ
jgi:hypothetical protein